MDLTQEFSLSILTDLCYQSIKITWLLPIFIDWLIWEYNNLFFWYSHETATAKNSCRKNRFLSIVNKKMIIGNYRLIDWLSDIGFYRLECTSQADKGL